MLGIVIGVGCVIAVVAIGNGATKSIEDTINSLGTNFIMIFPGASTQSGARIFTGNSTLTPEDADAIKTECPAVAYVSPTVRTAGAGRRRRAELGNVDPRRRASTSRSSAPGTCSRGHVLHRQRRQEPRAKVCVLGATVADNLFPQGDAVGQIVRIKNVPFKVVGVLEKKGGNMMGQDQDDHGHRPLHHGDEAPRRARRRST